MVEAHLNWIDGERFVVKASSGHAQVIDSDRLRNTAPGPMEMVLMGLCACTATDVVIILKKKREPFAALDVHAEAERAPDPPTIYTRINLVFTVSVAAPAGEIRVQASATPARIPINRFISSNLLNLII